MRTDRGIDKWPMVVSRSFGFALLWLLLSGGDYTSFLVAGPAVVLAVIISLKLLPSRLCIWHQLILFIPFFLLRSLLGGADVAWRAFHPGMPIVPDLVEYPVRLPAGLPQVFMANTISLLPGTLSATLKEDVIKVHVLDSGSDFREELEAVEKRVARVFGVHLGSSSQDKRDETR